MFVLDSSLQIKGFVQLRISTLTFAPANNERKGYPEHKARTSNGE